MIKNCKHKCHIGLFFCSFLALLLSLPACTIAQPPVEKENLGENTIVTFSADEGYRRIVEPLMDEFHQANPSIRIVFTPFEETNNVEGNKDEAETYRRLASSADAVIVSGRSAAMGNYFMDLRTQIESDASFDQDDFWPGSLSACQDAEGKVSGIPVSLYFTGIFYDKDAFDMAKLSYPQPGWTWDDFQKDIAALTQTRDGFTRYGYADRSFLSVLRSSIGANLDQTKGEINAKALTADLQWYLDLARAGLIYPIGGIKAQGEVKNADDLWTAMFQNNQAPAMWYGRLLEPNPGGSDDASDMDSMAGLAISKFGIAPFPIAVDGSDENTTPITGECIAISAGSTHPAAAWEWVKFLSSHWLVPDEKQASQWFKIPAHQSVADAAGFWNTLPEQARESIRYGLEHAWYPGLYQQAEVLVYEAIERAISGETDLASALEQAGAQLKTTPLPSGQPGEIVVATPETTQLGLSNAIVIDFDPGSTSPAEQSAVKALIERFNEEHQGAIVVKLPAKAAQNDDLGQFAGLSNTYDCYVTQIEAGAAATSGAVMSLSPLFDGEDATFRNDYIVEQLNSSRVEGELYVLPIASQAPVVVYNADLLARRGRAAPSDSWFFDEFVTDITSVASNSNDDQSFGLLPDSQAVSITDMLLAGQGAQWLGELSGLPIAHLNTPEMTNALIWLKSLYPSGALFRASTGENWWPSITQVVQTGKVGFWTVLAGQENDIYFDGEEPEFKIGITTLPLIEDSTYSFSHSIELGFYISTQSQNPQACWTLARFLSEQPVGYNGIPARKSVANSPAWESSVGIEKAEIYRKALAQNQSATNRLYPDTLLRPLQSWLGQAELDVLNGANTQQSLVAAQQKADSYHACIVTIDWSNLSEQVVIEKVLQCAKQADPQW